MDPNERKYETVTARRIALTDEEWSEEYRIIAEADRRDGTLEFLDDALDDMLEDEPDQK